jgi:hypothetical protein
VLVLMRRKTRGMRITQVWVKDRVRDRVRDRVSDRFRVTVK